jgi:prolyl oligopeptidase
VPPRRVSPLHTFKHLAELQAQLVKCENSPQTNPIVARIETKAGHGAGKPTSKIIEEAADMLAFAAAATGATLRA